MKYKTGNQTDRQTINRSRIQRHKRTERQTNRETKKQSKKNYKHQDQIRFELDLNQLIRKKKINTVQHPTKAKKSRFTI